MDVRRFNLKGIPVLETQGDIDHGNCAALEASFRDVIVPGNKVVLVDLTEVDYIDSGGLSVLFSALKQLREEGWLGLIGANPSIMRLLELVGLLADPGLRVFDDPQAAAQALDGWAKT